MAPPISSISIKAMPKAQADSKIVAEVRPLTEEWLAQLWTEAGERMGLQEIVAAGVPRIGDRQGLIEVDAQTVSFLEDFKPHKIDIMQYLREKTGMQMLDCHVNPLFVSKEEVIYSPDDKYAAMLEDNPKLAEFRKLFPIIDY